MRGRERIGIVELGRRSILSFFFEHPMATYSAALAYRGLFGLFPFLLILVMLYLANFANFGFAYGSIGAAVGLLLYLYICAAVVLLGAELNAAIYYPATVDDTKELKH